MRLRLIAFALTALAAGALLGWLMQRDPGYVFISLANYTLETSVWFALASMLALWVAAALAVALLRRVFSGRSRIAAWRQGHRQRQAQRDTTAGLSDLIEGRWQTARDALEGSAAAAGTPLVNYLAAARAAHESGDDAGRDALCEKAHAAVPEAAAAIALARARMLSDHGHWRDCQAALDSVLNQAPRHAEALALKLTCCRRLHDWQGVIATAAQLQKIKTADQAAAAAATVEAWGARLGAADDPAGVRELWQAMPRKLRRLPALASQHARALAAAGDADGAEAALKAALNANYDADLVAAYGALRCSRPAEQLATAERWLATHPDDPALTLALGRLSLAAGERDKAFEHLEASFKAAPTPACCAELGQLHFEAGQFERGRELLQRALVAG